MTDLKIPSVVWWHNHDGQKPALLFKVTKRHTFLVLLDEGRGVCVRRVPNTETEMKPVREVPIKLRPLPVGDWARKEYPLHRAIDHYLAAGKTWGISKAAVAALAEAAKSTG